MYECFIYGFVISAGKFSYHTRKSSPCDIFVVPKNKRTYSMHQCNKNYMFSIVIGKKHKSIIIIFPFLTWIKRLLKPLETFKSRRNFSQTNNATMKFQILQKTRRQRPRKKNESLLYKARLSPRRPRTINKELYDSTENAPAGKAFVPGHK